MAKRIMMGGGSQKIERLTPMRTALGEGKPNGRYGVRSRDCHATDAQMNYEYMKALQ